MNIRNRLKPVDFKRIQIILCIPDWLNNNICLSQFFPFPAGFPGHSRGLASKGQNRSLPQVSHPQTGQRRRLRSLLRNGSIGMNRKRQKNGDPRYHISAVAARDPASRRRLVFHTFIGAFISGDSGLIGKIPDRGSQFPLLQTPAEHRPQDRVR